MHRRINKTFKKTHKKHKGGSVLTLSPFYQHIDTVYLLAVASSSAFMFPSIYNLLISVMPFVRTVTVFLKCPGNFPLPLYVTLISPFCPGMIGFLVHSGTVQPQLATA